MAWTFRKRSTIRASSGARTAFSTPNPGCRAMRWRLWERLATRHGVLPVRMAALKRSWSIGRTVSSSARRTRAKMAARWAGNPASAHRIDLALHRGDLLLQLRKLVGFFAVLAASRLCRRGALRPPRRKRREQAHGVLEQFDVAARL